MRLLFIAFLALFVAIGQVDASCCGCCGCCCGFFGVLKFFYEMKNFECYLLMPLS
jgi:hypothetical protein